jgi:transcriptional regulator with XRE-family HTH domain
MCKKEVLSMDIGAVLKELRSNHELTQQQVADYLKVSQVTYNRYENNVREPNLETIYEICKFYKINILMFFVMLDREIITKENTISIIGGLMDYYIQLLGLKMRSLIYYGLVKSDEEYVYVENLNTKNYKIEIKQIINKLNSLKKLIVTRLVDYDNEINIIKKELKGIKNGNVYKENCIPLYAYEIYEK